MDIQLQISKVFKRVPGKHPEIAKKNPKPNRKIELNWSKRSIFWDLEYWPFLLLNNNYDVMHIEKNALEALLNTLLQNDKSKDMLKARQCFPITPTNMSLMHIFGELRGNRKTKRCLIVQSAKRVDGKDPRRQRVKKVANIVKPEFSGDPRNVRLGLAADGFNPFGMMSQNYSMWPVILTTYNTPSWMCMKETSLMLTMLIPGPRSPAKDIDVYLQPLIKELQELWKGVWTKRRCRQLYGLYLTTVLKSTQTSWLTEKNSLITWKRVFPRGLITRRPLHWKVVEHVYHRDAPESHQDVIHGSSSSHVTLSVGLTCLEHTDLSINAQSTEVDAPPVNDDNANANEDNADFINNEDDVVAHVLDDDDVEVSDDDEVNPSTNVEEVLSSDDSDDDN
ncbi:hypothetical protein Tco_0680556 [Tanacetum coccineum]|uniref:Uncharacterized protein n=1 Tax=Tanacetum coccineum TaxID=301880 RepID=A0ABQ4XLP8_9ASTR